MPGRLEYLEAMVYKKEIREQRVDQEAFDRLDALIQAGLGDVPQDEISPLEEEQALLAFERPIPRPEKPERKDTREKRCASAMRGWKTKQKALAAGSSATSAGGENDVGVPAS